MLVLRKDAGYMSAVGAYAHKLINRLEAIVTLDGEQRGDTCVVRKFMEHAAEYAEVGLALAPTGPSEQAIDGLRRRFADVGKRAVQGDAGVKRLREFGADFRRRAGEANNDVLVFVRAMQKQVAGVRESLRRGDLGAADAALDPRRLAVLNELDDTVESAMDSVLRLEPWEPDATVQDKQDKVNEMLGDCSRLTVSRFSTAMNSLTDVKLTGITDISAELGKYLQAALPAGLGPDSVRSWADLDGPEARVDLNEPHVARIIGDNVGRIADEVGAMCREAVRNAFDPEASGDELAVLSTAGIRSIEDDVTAKAFGGRWGAKAREAAERTLVELAERYRDEASGY